MVERGIVWSLDNVHPPRDALLTQKEFIVEGIIIVAYFDARV